MDALRVTLGKLALRVEGCDSSAKLRHGVKVAGEVVQHGDHMVRQGSTLIPLLKCEVYQFTISIIIQYDLQ